MRIDKRDAAQMRPVNVTTDYLLTAEGSVLIEVGNTRVLCAASIEETVPGFLRGSGKGWVTAEYSMLPRATATRTRARSFEGPRFRTHHGNPAADRPLAALGRRSGRARRAQRHSRLRRAASRRRHAHRRHHRRLHRHVHGAPAAGEVRRAEEIAASAIAWPPPASASSAAKRCSTSAIRRIRRPKSI